MLRAPVLVQDGVRLLLLERLLLLTEDLAQAGVRHLGRDGRNGFFGCFLGFFRIKSPTYGRSGGATFRKRRKK